MNHAVIIFGSAQVLPRAAAIHADTFIAFSSGNDLLRVVKTILECDYTLLVGPVFG